MTHRKDDEGRSADFWDGYHSRDEEVEQMHKIIVDLSDHIYCPKCEADVQTGRIVLWSALIISVFSIVAVVLLGIQ